MWAAIFAKARNPFHTRPVCALKIQTRICTARAGLGLTSASHQASRPEDHWSASPSAQIKWDKGPEDVQNKRNRQRRNHQRPRTCGAECDTSLNKSPLPRRRAHYGDDGGSEPLRRQAHAAIISCTSWPHNARNHNARPTNGLRRPTCYRPAQPWPEREAHLADSTLIETQKDNRQVALTFLANWTESRVGGIPPCRTSHIILEGNVAGIHWTAAQQAYGNAGFVAETTCEHPETCSPPCPWAMPIKPYPRKRAATARA